MTKHEIECVVIKETKAEWQRLCFTMASFLSVLSLMPKLVENELIALPVMALIIGIFGYFILLKDM